MIELKLELQQYFKFSFSYMTYAIFEASFMFYFHVVLFMLFYKKKMIFVDVITEILTRL